MPWGRKIPVESFGTIRQAFALKSAIPVVGKFGPVWRHQVPRSGKTRESRDDEIPVSQLNFTRAIGILNCFSPPKTSALYLTETKAMPFCSCPLIKFGSVFPLSSCSRF